MKTFPPALQKRMDEILEEQETGYVWESLLALVVGSLVAPKPLSADALWREVFPTVADVGNPADATLPFDDADAQRQTREDLDLIRAQYETELRHGVPFAFFPLPDLRDDPEEYLSAVMRRNEEISAFLWGLDLGGYHDLEADPDEDFLDLEGLKEDHLRWLEKLTLPQALMVAVDIIETNIERLEKNFMELQVKLESGMDPDLLDDDEVAEAEIGAGQVDFEKLWGALMMSDEALKQKFRDFAQRAPRIALA